MTFREQIWGAVNCDRGQDIAEYAVLIAVILIIVMITATAMGTSAREIFSRVGTALARVAQ